MVKLFENINICVEYLRYIILLILKFTLKPIILGLKKIASNHNTELSHLSNRVDIQEESNSNSNEIKKDNASHNQKENHFTFKPLDSGKLSFYDNFYIINGVPGFLIDMKDLDPIYITANASVGSEIFTNEDMTYTETESSLLTKIKTESDVGIMPPYEDIIEENIIESEDDVARLRQPWITTCCKFSPDMHYLIAGHNSGFISLWNADSARLIEILRFAHGAGITDIQFLNKRNNRILTCDWHGICSIINFNENGFDKNWTTINCAEVWIDTISNQDVTSLKPSFLRDGQILVYPIKISMNNTKNPILNVAPISQFKKHNYICHIYIFNTDEWMENNIEYPSPIVTLKFKIEYNFAITEIRIAPHKDKLIIGITDTELERGYMLYWEDFKFKPCQYERLIGHSGNWSLNDNDLFVTWTVIEETVSQDSEASCAFIFRDKKEKKSNEIEVIENDDGYAKEIAFKSLNCSKLTDPNGENVLWCAFGIDDIGNERLIMCVLSFEVRLVFWDLQSEEVTHVINSKITKDNVILGSKKCWSLEWVDGFVIRGLNPISKTEDMRWLGFMYGSRNQGIVWNAQTGTEMINISIPKRLSRKLGDGVDIIFGKSPSKFAIVGYDCIILFNPQIPGKNAINSHLEDSKCILPEAQMTEISYADNRIDMEQNAIIKFSNNNKRFGLLHPNSYLMSVYDLVECISSNFVLKHSEKTIYGGFGDYALNQDGSLCVTSTSTNALILWQFNDLEGIKVGILKEAEMTMTLGYTKDLVFSINEDVIIRCDNNGDLVWLMYFVVEIEKQDDEEQKVTSKKKKALEERSLSKILNLKDTSRHKLTNLFKKTVQEIKSNKELNKYHGEEIERVREQGNYGCRFSNDGKRAVVMNTMKRVTLWDLDQKMPIKEIEYQVEIPNCKNVSFHGRKVLIAKSPFSQSAVYVTPETMPDDYPSFNHYVSSFCLLAENDEIIITGSRHKDEPTLANASLLFPSFQPVVTVKSLIVSHMDGNLNPRELHGKKLTPERGLAISPDGRRIVCINDNNKIMVWCPYACSGLMPDYDRLNIYGKLKNRATIKSHVKRMFEKYGIEICCINYPGPSGLSLLLQSINEQNIDLTKELLRYALKINIKVSFLNICNVETVENYSWNNALELALIKRSPAMASQILKYLLVRVTHEDEISRILGSCLLLFIQKYPKLFIKTLNDPNLLINFGNILVPEGIFFENEYIMVTSDKLKPVKTQVEELWKDEIKNKENDITIEAVSKVLPYPFITEIGKKGVLRTLLLNSSSHLFFEALPLKALIQYKWKLFGYDLLIAEFANYSLLLAFYTAYCITLGHSEDYLHNNSVGVHSLVAIITILAFMHLLTEVKQISIFWNESAFVGIIYWLANGWNWMEVVSYIILVFFIPLYQIFPNTIPIDNKKFTVVVALESILLWCKMLYYAKVFRYTGSVIIMIGEIIRDVLLFLFLFFMVLFGFSVAFFVVYRHKRTTNATILEDGDEAFNEDEIDIANSFGSLGKSTLSMFTFILGDFDMHVIYGSPIQWVTIFLFVLYMILMVIILLNLLIAIMGDSFDKIKSTEETQFLKSRASAIDDLESMMSENMKKKLCKGMKKYLHILMPTEKIKYKTGTWKGRSDNIQKYIKKDIKRGVNFVLRNCRALNKEQKEIKKKLNDLDKTFNKHLPLLKGHTSSSFILDGEQLKMVESLEHLSGTTFKEDRTGYSGSSSSHTKQDEKIEVQEEFQSSSSTSDTSYLKSIIKKRECDVSDISSESY